MRYRLRTLLIFLALGPPMLAFFYFGPWIAAWSGGFDITAQFVNQTEKRIDRIEAAVVSNRKDANALVSHSETDESEWKPVLVDGNQTAVFHIRCSGHHTWLGREMDYWQQEAIALRITFDDGSQSLIAVDTPSSRSNRHLAIPIECGR